MIFGIVTLIIALAIAGVAAWFSIAGLVAIFSASAQSIAIMAGTLEVAKLVVASWLYRNWKHASLLMKTYLLSAVVVLMIITSMGIFGYLSKAHLDQKQSGNDATLTIQSIERKIDRERKTVADAETVIGQLDQAVQTLIDYDRIRGPEGSLAVRREQQPEREELATIISQAESRIAKFEEELFPLKQEVMSLELEVGPLKYVAELIYGESDASMLDKAVRLFILMFVFVFDPLAVIMVVAANQTLLRHGVELEKVEEAAPKHEIKDTKDEPVKRSPRRKKEVVEPTPDPAVADLESKVKQLESQLAKKPKQLKPKTVEIEKIVEVPVEKVVEKVVERPVEKIIEKIVDKTDTKTIKEQEQRIKELEQQLAQTVKPQAPQPNYTVISEEVVDENGKVLKPRKVALGTKQTLSQIATEIAKSEYNKEDLSADEILSMIKESSADEVKRKLGFWATPLPKEDTDDKPSNFKRK